MAACVTCKKSSPEVTLKRCAKCSTTEYCSRDCQKADWKSHRKTCGKHTHTGGPTAAPSSSTGGAHFSASTSLSPPKGLIQPVTKPFTRLDNGTWLHDRPAPDVYTLLIDAYRMRIEDDYTFDGDAAMDSIYGGRPDSSLGFRRFLARIEKNKRDLLPDWWCDAKKAECIAFGMSGPTEWASLETAVEKSDITEHYGDARFAMQLRMFVEAVYGRGPGGSDGTMMRKAMAAMEGGGTFEGEDVADMSMSVIDNTTGRVTTTTA